MPPSTQLSEADRAAVEEALASGRKIEAVRRYRNATGVGLKEAKEAVEAMPVAAASSTGPRSAVKSGSGCASVLLVGVGIGLLRLVL